MSQISTATTSSLRNSVLTQSASTHAATSPAVTFTPNFSSFPKLPINQTVEGPYNTPGDGRPPNSMPHLAVLHEMPQTHEPGQAQHLAFFVSVRAGQSEENTRCYSPPPPLSPTITFEGPRAGLPQNCDGRAHVPVNLALVVEFLSSGRGHQIKVDVVRDSCRRLRACLRRGDRLDILVSSTATTWRLLEVNTHEDYDHLREMLASMPQSRHARKLVNLVKGVQASLNSLLATRFEATCLTLMLFTYGAITEKDMIHNLNVGANIYNIAIRTFGLGLAHDPDSLVDLASRSMVS